MDWPAFIKTIGLCSISILLELISASKEGKSWFENLKQPKMALPFSAWYIVGGIYYLLCGTIAYRLFHTSSSLLSTPIILLSVAILFNGLTNFILFKYRSLRGFYLVLYPFAVVFFALTISLFSHDFISGILAGIYLLWLIYDLFYFRRLQRQNQ
ncbi:MAG: hypothetical protein GC192_07385 [Bacteroidetes bacterium]|nr:hypothetical protein [Bacteroidota bacterium]